MNENLQIFDYKSNKIRTVEVNGEPWFVLKDVCTVLGISNGRNVAARLDEDEKGVYSVDTLGGKQKIGIVNESGLYDVLLRSEKKEAKPFRKWVTKEVLPSIRKTGGYIAGQEQMTDLELLAQANLVSQRIIAERDKRIASLVDTNKELAYENKELKPKAEFADAITASDDAIPMAVFAKILCQNGILVDGRKPGQNILFENLRRTGYLCANKGKYWNTPQQCFVKMGYFKIDESLNPFGKIRYTTRITPKGQKYFIRLFKRVMAGEED